MAKLSEYTPGTHECGACFAEMSGYTWNELQALGWKSYAAGEGDVGFEMCECCVKEYEFRRECAKAFAA